MRDLVEGMFNAWEGAIAEHIGQRGQGGDFEKGLYFVEGLAMGGVADAEAVIRKGAVLVLVDGHVDVRVVEIVVRDVPISVSDFS